MAAFKEKRRFYRHPAEIPIQVQESSHLATHHSHSEDISEGGICFLSDHLLSRGTGIRVKIPVHDHLFRFKARVTYSRKDTKTGLFRTGISFTDKTSLYRAKLAEEILSMEKFRETLSNRLGRPVSELEAAKKWIQKHAKRFADIFHE